MGGKYYRAHGVRTSSASLAFFSFSSAMRLRSSSSLRFRSAASSWSDFRLKSVYPEPASRSPASLRTLASVARSSRERREATAVKEKLKAAEEKDRRQTMDMEKQKPILKDFFRSEMREINKILADYAKQIESKRGWNPDPQARG